jgi:hypothetical protein
VGERWVEKAREWLVNGGDGVWRYDPVFLDTTTQGTTLVASLAALLEEVAEAEAGIRDNVYRREAMEARAEVERLRKDTPTAGQEVWRAEANRQSKRAEKAEAEVERLRDQVENLLHRMTSEEAAAEIERLRVERQEDIFRLERLRADAFARAEKAEAEVERLRQTTGDLCDICGWRTLIAGRCAKCASEKAEAEVERLQVRVSLSDYALTGEVERLQGRVSLSDYAEQVARADLAEAEVERLRAELDRPRYETLRQLADAVERNEQLNAEVGRLRKDTPTAGQEVWRAEANRQSKRAEKAEAEVERLGETQRKFGTVQEELFRRAENAEAEVARLRARLELYDDGLAPEAVRALIVRRGL